jgi:hypothetical protein
MLLLRTERLPEGPDWLYELKLDGYRAQAIKTGSKVQLRSRNDKDFNARYPCAVKALGSMPDETVIDGEIVTKMSATDLRRKPLERQSKARFAAVFPIPAMAGELGSTYAIPIIYVPLLMITHFVAFYWLVRPRPKTDRAIAIDAAAA